MEKEKVASIEALAERGLYIIEDDDVVLENYIMQTLKEKDLTVSNLAELTGISRQNINAVVKNKMKPGVDFALKVSYVLGLPVEELFKLTDSAWSKPYKKERDSTLYFDAVNFEIIDNTVKKEAIAEHGYEYFNKNTMDLLTREEHAELLRSFLDEKTQIKVNELKQENSGLFSAQLISLAKEELRKEFNQTYSKIYKRLGKRFQPYVINSKKVVSKS